MKLEKDISKQIRQRLEVYQLTKEIEWWGRLNSLKVQTKFGGVVQGLPKGTPDFLALVRNHTGGITCLFIEAKSDSGQLRKEQLEFMVKYNHKDNFAVIVVRDIKELDNWIISYAKDFVKDI